MASIHSLQQHFEVTQYAEELAIASNEDLEDYWIGLFDITAAGNVSSVALLFFLLSRLDHLNCFKWNVSEDSE